MTHKDVQRANEARYKRSKRGKVVWSGHRGRVFLGRKPGRGLSKAEKKRVKKWSRGIAILNAAAEGKTVLRDKALKVSKDGDTLTLEGGFKS